MTPIRVFTVLASMGLVACVTQIEDRSDPERDELEESSAALDEEEAEGDDEIGVAQQALGPSDYDKTKADNLGNKARAGAPGTFRYCYRYVKRHLAAAGFRLPPELSSLEFGNHAADFIRFASAKADKLRTMGLGHVSIARGETYPLGTMVVYPRGACGYSPRSGHIEIVCDASGTRACSDFNGRLGAVARPGCSGYQSFLPGGRGNTSESCADKEDGFYCSAVSPSSAYECRNKTRGSAVFCEGGTSGGKTCGTADQRATVSDGKLTCSAASAASSSSSSSSSGSTSGGTSGGEEPGTSSSSGSSGSTSGGTSGTGGTGGSSEEPETGDSGNPSAPSGNWSCPGVTGQVIPSDGRYWMTTFGASDATSGTTCDDAGDNCIGACNAQAAEQGFCSAADVNRPAICERNVKWFVADADRYGCGSRVQVEMNGKSVVALVIDRGPHCRIERQKSAPVLDASPAVNEYLSGRTQNGVGGAQVRVTEVVADTPLGPVN